METANVNAYKKTLDKTVKKINHFMLTLPNPATLKKIETEIYHYL